MASKPAPKDEEPKAPAQAPPSPAAQTEPAEAPQGPSVTDPAVAAMISQAVTAAIEAIQPGRKRRVSVDEAFGKSKYTKAQRTPELDADPDLYWNGQHYQVTPEARGREVREIRRQRSLANDPAERARLAAEQVAQALAGKAGS